LSIQTDRHMCYAVGSCWSLKHGLQLLQMHEAHPSCYCCSSCTCSWCERHKAVYQQHEKVQRDASRYAICGTDCEWSSKHTHLTVRLLLPYGPVAE
jgi:hypothetical protein